MKGGTSPPRAPGRQRRKHFEQSQLKVETKTLHANEAASGEEVNEHFY